MPDRNRPVDDAPKIPGGFGVDTDPYTDDDSLGQEDDDEDDER